MGLKTRASTTEAPLTARQFRVTHICMTSEFFFFFFFSFSLTVCLNEVLYFSRKLLLILFSASEKGSKTLLFLSLNAEGE